MKKIFATAVIGSTALLGGWAATAQSQPDATAPGAMSCCLGGPSGCDMPPGSAVNAPAGAEQLAEHRHQHAALNEQEQSAVNQMTRSYTAISQRLVEDKLEGVSQQLATIRQASDTLAKSADANVKSKAMAVSKAAQFKLEDLKQARAGFKQLSAAVIDLAQIAPPTTAVAKELYVASCPMAKAQWLQTEKQIANPYMGQEMPRCGMVQKTIETKSDKK